MKIKSIAVYCSSSDKIDQKYKEAARHVGELLAKNSIRLVYGGGGTGLMKEVSDACMKSGGDVLGITTEHLGDLEEANIDITELKIEKGMHSRKKKMFLEADAFIALPGGLGTLEEVFEILTWKQIGLHTKPFVFLNQDGFWDPLHSLIEKMIIEKMTPSHAKNLYSTVGCISEILEGLKRSAQAKYNSTEK